MKEKTRKEAEEKERQRKAEEGRERKKQADREEQERLKKKAGEEELNRWIHCVPPKENPSQSSTNVGKTFCSAKRLAELTEMAPVCVFRSGF